MYKYIVFCLLFSIFNGSEHVLSINDKHYSIYDFFSIVSKQQWDRSDSLKKDKLFSDFVEKQLCILEAKSLSLDKDPSANIKIINRSKQLLVNESYETLVAEPLINKNYLEQTRKNAKIELFIKHILIGFNDSYLAAPPNRNKEDALNLANNIYNRLINGELFSELAIEFSDDPSIIENHGDVGWVSWGSTVPEFQLVAFSLDINEPSKPVLTSFGFHIILVKEKRASTMALMSPNQYKYATRNLAKNSIRNLLREEALKYDSLQIISSGLLFNKNILLSVVEEYNTKSKKASLANKPIPSASEILSSVDFKEPVCIFNNKGYGVKWFGNKIQKIPKSRQPSLDSFYNIETSFKTILLQSIAINKAEYYGIDSSFAYLSRKEDLISGILYDLYLKHIVSTANNIDSSDVKKYYRQNIKEKYTFPDMFSVRELKVEKKFLADSLLLLLNKGEVFPFLANRFSLINPVDSGMVKPFSKQTNSLFYNKVLDLSPGEYSSILSTNGGFSILQLVNRIPGKQRGLASVYTQIESLLRKNEKKDLKKDGILRLYKKYNITENKHLLN
tara:strand:+ start:1223 stop:2905 length:1683 start_codon:yes stop_codon:yes gene_type:complete